MQISSVFTAAILVLGVTARKHHYCNCHVNQKIDAGLSKKTCDIYGRIYGNVEFIAARATCSYKPKGDGIDYDTFHALCKAEHGGDVSGTAGNCFKH
ncbi:hypothetical protein F4808DRAFT_455883 [Astrocystis sublimbata]|nr:hypothetical protein F4808DRAFT_455883 [Astrocystis sublimbata]